LGQRSATHQIKVAAGKPLHWMTPPFDAERVE